MISWYINRKSQITQVHFIHTHTNILIYIYWKYIYIYIYIYICRRVFSPSQDSSVQLRWTSREQLMSQECSKQGAELCQIACGKQTSIKFVLISVIQKAQQIDSERAYPQIHVSYFPGLISSSVQFRSMNILYNI